MGTEGERLVVKELSCGCCVERELCCRLDGRKRGGISRRYEKVGAGVD